MLSNHLLFLHIILGSSPLMKPSKSSPRVGNEIDGDWEMVSKREITNEISSSGGGGSNELNDSGVMVEKSEPEDEDEEGDEVDPSVPTFVEADILAQIKRMFKQQVCNTCPLLVYQYVCFQLFLNFLIILIFFAIFLLMLRTMVVIQLPKKKPSG